MADVAVCERRDGPHELLSIFAMEVERQARGVRCLAIMVSDVGTVETCLVKREPRVILLEHDHGMANTASIPRASDPKLDVVVPQSSAKALQALVDVVACNLETDDRADQGCTVLAHVPT